MSISGSKSVLVTGGAGYIGSHVCKRLSESGFTPITYDNFTHGHDWAVKWGPSEKGDILDGNRLNEVLKKYDPFAAVHLAALLVVSESVSNPMNYYQNNVTGTLTLLEALSKHAVKNFVFSSSAAVFGSPKEVPVNEYQPLNPITPYGTSKMMIERILDDFDSAYDLKSISLRYFNAAGADPSGEIGEVHDPETHLIPLVLQAADGERESITIFGTDYDTPDGTCIRDYIHVTDLAEAHVLALKALDGGSPSNQYNMGNEKGTSVREIIQVAEKVVGKKIPVQEGDRRPGDPPKLVASSSLVREELGWKPKHDSIENIVSTAWNFKKCYRENILKRP